MPVHIKPLTYLAECNTFPDYIKLLTLCLAPLIAHLVSGTPPISYLAESRPKFVDTLCHYNPTSIIWRYAAIVDRRLRATKWTPNDLAATNALFWTTKGWNGDESMVNSAAPYRVQTPQKTHVDIFSATMLKTLIVSLQGVSALYSIVGGLTGSIPDGGLAGLGLDTIFFPLAMIGLLRLCAAAWLTEDFAYFYPAESLRGPVRHTSTVKADDIPLFVTTDDMDPWLTATPSTETSFRAPNSSLKSCAFRTFYLLVCMGLCVFPLIMTVPKPDVVGYYSVTSFLVGVFYSVCLSLSSFVYAFYFVRGKTTTTIIPCISSSWYRCYTILLMGSIVVIIAIAAVQTNQLPNGSYSSFPQAIQLDCKSRFNWWVVSPRNPFSGVMSLVPSNGTALEDDASGVLAAGITNETIISNQRYLLHNLTGYCVGQVDGM